MEGYRGIDGIYRRRKDVTGGLTTPFEYLERYLGVNSEILLDI